MRLSLFRNFRRKVKKDARNCKCFNENAIKRMNEEDLHDKKAWRHRSNCYLNQGNINNDFRQLLTKNVFELLLDDKRKELHWYESGKYVLNPENIVMQLWMNISTWIYLISLISSTLIIAFDYWFLETMSYYECFFDVLMLSDIILVFFTASEIPVKDEKRRKE